jgi:TolB-like protein/class 3 adenylate cyclase
MTGNGMVPPHASYLRSTSDRRPLTDTSPMGIPTDPSYNRSKVGLRAMVQERPVRVERRLAAILAADVAGYSRLMHRDEEATHARLAALLTEAVHPAIAEHGGRIVKNTGDGFLAEFPSAVEAVRAAIQFQARIHELAADEEEDSRIAFRVGINVGDVIIEPYDIFGDGVNIAARLEGIAEPGGICISSSACEHVRGRVRATFADLGEQNLKNIALPVRVYAVIRDGSVLTTPVERARSAPLSPPRLSIIVLPFANLSGDPGQDYFVDGVTESLTTDLSRISGSFVIAHNTALTFKGKGVDVKQIGRELNVRYVLEGSVQRGGNRLRVNVQLIAAEAGNHLWAERFDKPAADLFDMQDEIVSRLANTLNSQLIAVEARRAERSPHPDAIDLCFQGAAWANKGRTPEYLARARGFYERALALEPGNVEALVGTAWVNCSISANVLTDDRIEHLAAAEETVTKVLSLAPNHPIAHYVLGLAQTFTNRAAQGIAKYERALALDRNFAYAHAHIGLAKLYLGRGGETEAHIEQALRLSPRDTVVYIWTMFVGIAKLWHGADTEAIVWLRRSLEANRNSIAHFYLAAVLAHGGELDEARATARAGLALYPSFTIRRYRTNSPSNHPVYLAGRERVYEGLRMAGVPEG